MRCFTVEKVFLLVTHLCADATDKLTRQYIVFPLTVHGLHYTIQFNEQFKTLH